MALKELKVVRKSAGMSKHKAYAIAFLKRADKGWCRQLLMDLENQFTPGTNHQ